MKKKFLYVIVMQTKTPSILIARYLKENQLFQKSFLAKVTLWIIYNNTSSFKERFVHRSFCQDLFGLIYGNLRISLYVYFSLVQFTLQTCAVIWHIERFKHGFSEEHGSSESNSMDNEDNISSDGAEGLNRTSLPYLNDRAVRQGGKSSI